MAMSILLHSFHRTWNSSFHSKESFSWFMDVLYIHFLCVLILPFLSNRVICQCYFTLSPDKTLGHALHDKIDIPAIIFYLFFLGVIELLIKPVNFIPLAGKLLSSWTLIVNVLKFGKHFS